MMGWFWEHLSSKSYTCKDGYLWLVKKSVNWHEDCNWLWLWRLQLEQWSISKVKGLCLSLTKDLKNAAHFQTCISHQFLIFYWIPPFESQMKLNCDASFIPKLNSAGFACVIRNSSGNWVIETDGTILKTSILRCELFAVWRGLLLARDNGHREVICETDNIDVFRFAQWHCRTDGANNMNLIFKVHELLSRKSTVDVQLI
ncbi:hypothetical protein PIB30_064030 [Stylosanthes scabra]|uniref:RNase H type-1 domain-containing protein n=1 Tax=Stylosanthes scabra TaxID=79078 RepID=A0ABU6TLE4_9FABA|nr:hypothetical protein [Stylosanthes scabra]